MSKRVIPVQAYVTLDAYRVIEEYVERGVAYGLCRHNKYASPDHELAEDLCAQLQVTLTEHVMTLLCEVVQFPDP